MVNHCVFRRTLPEKSLRMTGRHSKMGFKMRIGQIATILPVDSLMILTGTSCSSHRKKYFSLNHKFWSSDFCWTDLSSRDFFWGCKKPSNDSIIPSPNFNTKKPREKMMVPKPEGPAVQPCELTKWGKGKIDLEFVWRETPGQCFFFNLHWIYCVFTSVYGPRALSQHISESAFRRLKVFFKACHMSSETNGLFTVNWTHLLSGFGQLCDSPGWHHQMWRSTTSEDFWLTNFSKKTSLRSSWKKNQVLFCDCISFLIVDVLRFKILRGEVNATTCIGMFALGETACWEQPLPSYLLH